MNANQIAAEYDAIFAACTSEAELGAVISGIDFAPMTGALVAHITASADNAINRIRRTATASQPATPHAKRETVIDRAIANNRKYTDDQVTQFATLREVALDYVRTYRGLNSFVQDLAVKLADRGVLSAPQMRGALNVMVAEARSAREAASRASVANIVLDAEAAYMDLRSKTDRVIEEAGEAPDTDRAQLTRRTPNGTYTIIVNPDLPLTGYRTIKLEDAPDFFKSAPGTQVASYLSGADNEASYTRFAFVTGDMMTVWRKFRTTLDSKIVRALKTLLASEDPIAYMLAYGMKYDRCGVCGRKLTTPDSKRLGIGPICAGNLQTLGYTVAGVDAATSQAARQRAISDMGELFPE